MTSNPTLDDLSTKWKNQLADWAIPDSILQKAEDNPWQAPVELLMPKARAQDKSPTVEKQLQLLPEQGTVLDVGVGPGSGALCLAEYASHITGVDQSLDMLEVFVQQGRQRGIDVQAVKGTWPEISPQVQRADLVISHHVAYNVSDIVGFIQALFDHAKSGVVIEVTAQHPMASLNPFWDYFYQIQRPSGPNAKDLFEIIVAMGFEGIEYKEFTSKRNADASSYLPQRIEFMRRRLCLPKSSLRKVQQAVDKIGLPDSSDNVLVSITK